MIRLLDPVAALGRVTLNLVSFLGELGLFTASAIVGLLRPPFYLRNFSRAFAEIERIPRSRQVRDKSGPQKNASGIR